MPTPGIAGGEKLKAGGALREAAEFLIQSLLDGLELLGLGAAVRPWLEGDEELAL